MAVREDGTIYAWGRNANGVLGNRVSPYDVKGPAFKPFEPVAEAYAPDIYDMPFPILVQPF
jgi:alpha-tubulin suppressor-like RCC1 family protein